MQTATFRHLCARCEGAAGAEFAITLPLLVLFLFGVIDVGRYMWSINQLEKATQVGVRMAVVTDMIPEGLATQNYADTLGQGASIPVSSFGAAQCQKPAASVTCSCATTPCPTLSPVNSAAFDAVTGRMKQIAPDISDADITIRYENSGLGYAGDPNGPDVAPIVTVKTQGVRFAPLILFGFTTTLPTESASLTLEDASGTTSN